MNQKLGLLQVNIVKKLVMDDLSVGFLTHLEINFKANRQSRLKRAVSKNFS